MATSVPAPRQNRLIFGRKTLAAVGAALLLAAAVAVFALIEGDIPEAAGAMVRAIRPMLRGFGHLAPIALLYAEESGVPMPLPGDIFVMYVGRFLPPGLLVWLAAWVGMVLIVVLGASNLFWISRRLGRDLPEHRLGRWLHVTPAGVARAQGWFDRWGPAALIFGRHIPGCRVPLTIAAAVCGVSYKTFVLSVTVSTAAWVGAFLYIGVTYGGRMEHLIRVHRETYLIVPLIIAIALLVYFFRKLQGSRSTGSA
jgi:membrane protein DedA with SNARE-associated domain